MGNFKSDRRGSRPGGRSSGRFGGGRGEFRDRDSGRPMGKYDAVCAKCGKACQVPFRPSGSKPVLCSDCFRQRGDARDSPRQSSSTGISHEQINQINAKLDKIIKILENLEMVVDNSEDNETKNDSDTDTTTE